MLHQSPVGSASFSILAARPETPSETHELVHHLYNSRDHSAETLKQNENKPDEEPKYHGYISLKI